MSEPDTDFSDYVAARWSTLYRTAYVLRAHSALGEELAQATLAKAYGSWPQIRASPDPDALVRDILLATSASWRTRRSWAGTSTSTEVLGSDEVDDDVLPVADSGTVLRALIKLPPGQRAVLTLRCYHDLGVREIAELLGWSSSAVLAQNRDATARLRRLLTDAHVAVIEQEAGTEVMVQDVRVAVRGGVAEVPVRPLGMVIILAEGKARRRRRRATIATVLAAGVAVAAGVLALDDSEPPRPTPAPVERRTVSWEGLDVPWIDGHRISYGEASIRRPTSLTSLAATADSAVMTVGRGPVRIVELRPNGTRTVIGQHAVGIALADTAGHLAAWTEIVDARTSQVVAYDTATQTVLATTAVNPGMQVYAMNGRTLVLNDGKDGYLWEAGSGEQPVPFEPGTDEQLITDLTDSHVFVTDFGVGAQLLERNGKVVANFPETGYSAGSFDPSGRFISGLRLDSSSASMTVYDVERERQVPLQLASDVGWTRWLPDGRLVVRTTARDRTLNAGDTPVHYSICQASDGTCLPLAVSAATLRQAEGVQVGFLGQVTMTSTF